MKTCVETGGDVRRAEGVRIAVIADIHGNLPALEAVLAEIRLLKADRIVVAGDIVVGSPDSLACWQRVKALGCPVLRGNHERYVCDFGTERGRPEWATPQFGPVQFAVKNLGRDACAELAALPAVLRLPEAPDVLFCHGSPRSDTDLVYPYTSDAELGPMFAGTTERWIMRGHNHYSGVRLWGARRVVTVGSVGLPLDGTVAAQFAVIEKARGDDDWTLRHRAVPYDVGATMRRFRESGYLAEAGPMAELFRREVTTAALHIVPFLAFQAELRQRGRSLPLAEEVALYLRTGVPMPD